VAADQAGRDEDVAGAWGVVTDPQEAVVGLEIQDAFHSNGFGHVHSNVDGEGTRALNWRASMKMPLGGDDPQETGSEIAAWD
jgi:hypothetical protein